MPRLLCSKDEPLNAPEPVSKTTGRAFRTTMAVDPMIQGYEALELALRRLHLRGNSVAYTLLSPIFGWRVDGKPGGKVVFGNTVQNGVLEREALYVRGMFPDGPTKDMVEFMRTVAEAKMERLRIVFEEWELYETFDQPFDYNFYVRAFGTQAPPRAP